MITTRISRHELESLHGAEWAGIMRDFLKRKGVSLKDEKIFLIKTEAWDVSESLIPPWIVWTDISTGDIVIEQDASP